MPILPIRQHVYQGMDFSAWRKSLHHIVIVHNYSPVLALCTPSTNNWHNGIYSKHYFGKKTDQLAAVTLVLNSGFCPRVPSYLPPEGSQHLVTSSHTPDAPVLLHPTSINQTQNYLGPAYQPGER